MSAHTRLDRCPRCRKPTRRLNVYLMVTALASFIRAMSKKAIATRHVKVEAALWDGMSWWCSNPACGHSMRGAKQVRLEPIS